MGQTDRPTWAFPTTLLSLVLLVALGLASCSLESKVTYQSRGADPVPAATDPAPAAADEAPLVEAPEPTADEPAADEPPAAEPAGPPLSALAGWSDPVTLPTVGDSSFVSDLVQHGEMLVAVGGADVGEQRQPVVWLSADGATWEAIEVPTAAAGIESMSRVTSLGEQLVAIGNSSVERNSDAVAWTSLDGRSWQPISGLPNTGGYDRAGGLAVDASGVWISGFGVNDEVDLSDYSIGADGTVFGPDPPDEPTVRTTPLVSGGYWGAGLRPFLLRSTDGVAWESVDLGGLGLVEIHDLTSTAAGALLAAGLDIDDRVGVWERATDGTWAPLASGLPVEGSLVASVRDWQGALVVTMVEGSGATRTADGAWAPLPDLFFRDLDDLGDRLVAVAYSQVEGTDEYRGHIAESTDGVNWSAIDLGGDHFPASLVNHGDGLLAVGSVRVSAEVGAPSVWTGGSRTETVTGIALDPLTWEPEPAPAEPPADLIRLEGTTWTTVLANRPVRDVQPGQDLTDVVFDRAVDLVVTTDGAAWVATEQQGVYRLLDGVWTRFGRDEGLPTVVVVALAAGPGGSVVAATAAGLSLFDGAGFVDPPVPPSVTDSRVLAMVGDGTRVWVATASGLVSFDSTGWRHHAAADGLPAPEVVGGELPAGLARNLWLTDAGVVAELVGASPAAWDGTNWTLLPLTPFQRIAAVGRDGSVVYAVENEDSQRTVSWWHPDGSVDTIVGSVSFTNAAVGPDGTVWVSNNLFELYEYRGGSLSGYSSLAGLGLGYCDDIDVIGDRVLFKGGSALFVLDGGTWTAHVDVAGLGYPLSGADNSFSTGAVYDLAGALDGSVWALVAESLPEWDG